MTTSRRWNLIVVSLAAAVGLVFVTPLPAQNDSDPAADAPLSEWAKLIAADGPELHWSFDGATAHAAVSSQPDAVVPSGVVAGALKFEVAGPNRSDSRYFTAANRAVEFPGSGAAIKLTDPGEKSLLDFDKGDALTIEAWVNPRSFGGGRYMYIVGKGRTNNKGVAKDNQSYALRLQGNGDQAVLSYLFHSAGDDSGFHRWTSSDGFTVDGKWHHVAVTYEFGKADSLRGYVDGQPVGGAWDLLGATDKGPVVDNDELWIGSSMGMQAGSTFNGQLDEVAIYRKALSAERFLVRVPEARRPAPPPMPEASPPRDSVLIEVLAGIPDKVGWADGLPEPSESWTEPAFAFFDMPKLYSDRGIQIDRPNPLILRARSLITLPAGRHRLLLRTLRYGRLFIDGRLVLETPVRPHRPNAHGRLYELTSELAPGSRPLYPGAEERLAEIEFDGREHEFRLDIHVGGQKRRLELGETSLSIAPAGEADSQANATASNDFRVLSPTGLDIPLTDNGWETYERQRRDEYVVLNQQRRHEAGAHEDLYWQKRHRVAQQIVDALPPLKVPAPQNEQRVSNAVDSFVVTRLEAAKLDPAPQADDWTFLRRVSLDVIGTPPTQEMLREFFADQSADRRARFVDRLLEHPGWADAWVGYWQDVLAENPNVVNPTLNNTGPFRWWIHESFLDNKPIDRFATELIEMRGSSHFGGPAGFELATQNDVPYAAKAHIVGQAFLAYEMKCARCHDAPYHDFNQSDLFSLAGMLKRGAQSVPKTSSIPSGESNSELVKVSMKPGDSAPVAWPFEERINGTIPEGFLRTPGDQREELAARITTPHNERFAQVIANRIWKRYLGRGIIDPVDDWEHADPSHPELLDYLGRELIRSGYDLKHLARLILNSQTYQRAVAIPETPEQAELYAVATRRRLTAEQLVDSLFEISGKEFRAGDMNIDVDGSRSFESSLNLGIPQRAWMFSSLSNERDRPSLALPYAQPFVTLLETFGWQESRQSPISQREEAATVLQPAIVANGVLGRRFTRLSDDSIFTQMALQDRPVSELVDEIYQRVLTRKPNSEERAVFVELLSEGYATRINRDQLNAPVPRQPGARTGVGWSNHLDPRSNTLQIETQEVVRLGDIPTRKLKTEWRERFEDGLWALLNSPEFIFVP
ncbi:DUF1553 domain-containing protein [bacterium]|nr:DUF1553 domain-containing protein [bacterium]